MIIYALFILLFIILFQFKEGFTQEKESETGETIILLGDSILDNKIYVKKNESIEYLLRESPNKILFLAKDNSFISDVLLQMNQIEKDVYDKKNLIFLSIGGNDILDSIKTKTINNKTIVHLFEDYKKLIIIIKQQFLNSTIYLLNIYYPTDEIYKPYYEYINEWNLLLSNYIQTNNSITEILIDKLCYLPIDFVHKIEPSKTCSIKIAENILSKVKREN